MIEVNAIVLGANVKLTSTPGVDDTTLQESPLFPGIRFPFKTLAEFENEPPLTEKGEATSPIWSIFGRSPDTN